MTEDETLRLQCLQLAQNHNHSPEQVLAAAREFYAFVKDMASATPPASR